MRKWRRGYRPCGHDPVRLPDCPPLDSLPSLHVAYISQDVICQSWLRLERAGDVQDNSAAAMRLSCLHASEGCRDTFTAARRRSSHGGTAASGSWTLLSYRLDPFRCLPFMCAALHCPACCLNSKIVDVQTTLICDQVPAADIETATCVGRCGLPIVCIGRSAWTRSLAVSYVDVHPAAWGALCTALLLAAPGLAASPVQGLRSNRKASDLQDSLVSAVKKRMMSDAPLGVLLSGGLDSSLVAAIAARCAQSPTVGARSFWRISTNI